MSRLCLYYLSEPERDRWFSGDRFIRPAVRRLIRGAPRPGGLDKVFINLRLGLDRIGEHYEINLPFRKVRPDDRVAVLGRGHHCLDGYDRSNPIVAGIGLMTHPSEWPTLCTDYPVVKYLQHSAWCDAVYRPWFGERCAVWPVGIDTDRWQPVANENKTVDFLIYDKIHWDHLTRERTLLNPIQERFRALGFSYETIRYGSYAPDAFRNALRRCRAMIFLSAHESQGIAYQEALSSGVPLLAWDPGFVEDPERFRWGQPEIPATSVPYFDPRCGLRFRDFEEFVSVLPEFNELSQTSRFHPRDYILEHLTLEISARHFLTIVNNARA